MKPGRCSIALDPDTTSDTTRLPSTLKPAASISCNWLPVLWPAVDTRGDAKPRADVRCTCSNTVSLFYMGALKV